MLDRYALLAVECGFTPAEVDQMTLEQVNAIISLLARRNQERLKAYGA